jgi:WD40 repeat protein
MAGKHDGAVRCVEYDADHGLVISGSWDCSVRCWDPRSNTLVANLRQPHKVYSMTQAGSRLVVATAQRTVNVYEKRMLVSLSDFVSLVPDRRYKRREFARPPLSSLVARAHSSKLICASH